MPTTESDIENEIETFERIHPPVAAAPSAATQDETDHDSCSHWREGDSDNCVWCGDDLGPTTDADVYGTAAAKPSGAVREAAQEINNLAIAELGRQFYGPVYDRLIAIVSRHCFSGPAKSVDHAGIRSELDEIRKRLNEFHAEYERPIVVKDIKRLVEICDLLLPGQ